MSKEKELALMSEEYFNKIDSYKDKIDSLSKDGELRIGHLEREIKRIKIDSSIKVEEQKQNIEALKKEIAEASLLQQKVLPEITAVRTEAVEYIEQNIRPIIEKKYEIYKDFLTSKTPSLLEAENKYKLDIKNKKSEFNVLTKSIYADLAKFSEDCNQLSIDDRRTKESEFDALINDKVSLAEAKINEMVDLEKSIYDTRLEYYREKSDLLKTVSDYALTRYYEFYSLFYGKVPSNLMNEFKKFIKEYNREVSKGFVTGTEYKIIVSDYQRKLNKVRLRGENGVELVKDKIAALKKNSDYSKEDKALMLVNLQNELIEKELNKKMDYYYVQILQNEGIGLVKIGGKHQETLVNLESMLSNLKAKAISYKSKFVLETGKRERQLQIQELVMNNDPEIQEEKKQLIDHAKKADKLETRSFSKDIKEVEGRVLNATKRNNHEAFLQNQSMITAFRNGSPSLAESVVLKAKNYIYNFKLSQHLLKNGLYYAIILYYIICVIINPVLISGTTVINILSTSSVRVFYSLGVAALILLAGTDLSIGRMIGLGTVFSTMCMQSSFGTFKLFGAPVDLSSVNPYVQILLGLLIAVTLTTAFSAFSGFFTAKFKMHPFISTLGAQLIIYGLLSLSTNNANTSVVSEQAKTLISWGTSSNIGLILYALIAIAIVWFIWNKTRFGKNLYAVGGNSEAAAVSGISVFKITMLAFVMAGILYGFGSFFEGIRLGTSNANVGSGNELDAIAACVVGGVSFSGGIGKISGVVIGTILFELLTTSFNILGFNSGLSFFMKGAIILFAVTLDSIKYLKKK